MKNLFKATRSLSYSQNQPFDYEADRKAVVQRVNGALGLSDGGNLCIAQGNVLYEHQQNDRRLEIINVPTSFYQP